MSRKYQVVLSGRLLGFALACLLILLAPDQLMMAQSATPQTQPADVQALALTEDMILTMPQESSDSELILRILVPSIEEQEIAENGQRFRQISVEGYGHTSQTGKPQIPVKGFFLAVPEGARIEVEVLKSEVASRSGYNIYPVPRPVVREAESGTPYTAEEFYIDEAAYSSHDYYPNTPAEIGTYGYLRDLRVAQLRVFPVQYKAATGDLLFHKLLWLKIRLIGGSFPPLKAVHDGPDGTGDPFEQVYKSVVLNYDPALLTTHKTEKREVISPPDRSYLMNDPFKISVEEDGIYEIEYEDLVAAGADFSGVDPGAIKMFYRGSEIPISVHGEMDGTFDAGDYILFFGTGNRSEYSRSNVYWMSWGGNPGLRMEQRDCSPGDSLSVPTSFAQMLHFEEDRRYYSNVFQGEGKDHWFWEQLTAPRTRSYPIALPSVAAGSSDVQMRINLRGKTALPHHTEVFINDHQVADLLWDGMVELDEMFSCPPSFLLSSDNELVIQCPLSSLDQTFFNWFEIEYQRHYAAQDGSLRFRDPVLLPNQFEITGFADSRIEVFQITDPTRVARLAGHSVVTAGSGYTVIFEAGEGQEEYFVVDATGRKQPASIIEDVPSDLRHLAGGADYVIITHADFYESVQPLKELRQSEGLRVQVVRTEDIYDEFSDGNFDPLAVKDFLEYSYYNWQPPAPTYVLLVGDASFDYKGNTAGANANYVPAHLFVSQSEYLQASSDDWFTYLAGDDLLPDMLIGRLSAQTAAEVEQIIRKIIDYEVSVEPGDWRQRALLVADDPDAGGDFESVSDRFADDYFVPAGFDLVRAYVRECGGGCRTLIVNTINDGVAICNFLGHGSLELWAAEEIFTSSDVSRLSNFGKLPLVVALTCLNGFFHHAYDDYCLAEEFLRAPDKGAVACWAHSGLDYTSSSDILGGNLYEALLTDGNYVLGSAVCQAKMGYLSISPYFWDQALMLILFGDPALEMGFPGRADLLTGSIAFRPRNPKAGEPDTLAATIHNAGREDASAFSVRFSNGHPDSSGSTIIAEMTVPSLKVGEQTPVYAVWDSVPDPGSYCVVVEVDPDDGVLESCEWNNVSWDSLSVRPADDVDDGEPPEVRLVIDGKSVGTEFQDLDYVSSDPIVEAIATDDETGIDIEDVRVTLNGEPLRDVTISREGAATDTVRVACRLGSLADGTYTLDVRVFDCASPPNDADASVRFIVASGLTISRVGTYPNPSPGVVSVRYSLSQGAPEVAVQIYSVTGRLVRTVTSVAGRQNGNEIDWDGRDDHGEPVGMGVYFYRIVARRGGERCSCTGTVTLIR